MACPATQIDIDTVGPAVAAPPVQVTVNDLNNAGAPTTALLADFRHILNPSTTTGGYNTNTAGGRGLGCSTSSPTSTNQILVVLDPFNPPTVTATTSYLGANYQMDFLEPHTEFGFGIGDYVGPMRIQFFDQNVAVLTATTSTFSSATKFFRLSGACFDRVIIEPDNNPAGNFVITEIWTQQLVGGVTTPFTTGPPPCLGSNGLPIIQAPSGATPFPRSCRTYNIQITGALPNSGAAFNIGTNAYSPPGFPLSLISGPPACFVKIPLAPVAPFGFPFAFNAAGNANIPLAIPPGFCGGPFSTEAWVVDTGFFGTFAVAATTSNLLEHTIQ